MSLGDLVISLYVDNRLLVGLIESELYFKEDETYPYVLNKKVK
jgi:hypothetical protein